MSDDITFCASECNCKNCFRHPSNIKRPDIPHSFADLKGTEDCKFVLNTSKTNNDGGITNDNNRIKKLH